MIYARSVPNVEPAAHITWFQAQQALANSGKPLPTNAEWQMAVAGAPESACNVSTGSVSNTGVFGNCVSDWGLRHGGQPVGAGGGLCAGLDRPPGLEFFPIPHGPLVKPAL